MDDRTFTQNMLSLAAQGGIGAAFSRFLDVALMLNSGVENIARTLISAYAKPERCLFLTAYYSLLEESICRGKGRNDVLGQFYADYVRHGHVPVPQHYCDMTTVPLTAGLPTMRVADYRCRTGRRLMAAAGHNRWLRLYGADSDVTMVRMTLLNFFMNDFSGEVAWYDAGSDTFHAAWGVDLDYRGKPVIRKLEQQQSLIFQKRDGQKPQTARLVFGF